MKRSKFSLSNYKLTTMNMGGVYPIGWYEALPGDTVQQATSALIRATPLLAPVMHPVRVRIHHFFVPNRLIWEDFEEFITGGADGTSTPTHPYFSDATIAEGSLSDHLGVPPDTYSPALTYSALPARAYNLIWNTYFRDQDLGAEEDISLASGLDSTTGHMTVKRASWEKDYFTAARPWETKGDAINIPLAGEAKVSGIGTFDQTFAFTTPASYETDGTGTTTYAKGQQADGLSGANSLLIEEDPNNSGFPNIRAELAAATGMDINDLRLSLALQRYQEARAKYGSRYVEYLRYLGVKSSDARLNNPEYLGGGRQIIQFSEVLSTDGGNTGNLKGHGIAALRTNKYRRYFEEHGIVMTLMSVLPKTIYTQTLNRAWLRDVKEDYFQRELQYIGEQEITNKEALASHSSPSDVFGYQSRYDEYRSIPSSIAGEFHSTQDHWHLARIHTGDIALNSSFVEATPTKRVFADNENNCLYVMANHSIQARRMLTPVAKNKTF